MDTEPTSGVTSKFLESFLPVWDKISSFKVQIKCDEPIRTIRNHFPKIIELFVKVVFENPKKKPTNLVIKTPSPESLSNFRRLKWFEKEIFFHDVILIEFRNLLSNCDSKDKNSLKLSTEAFIAGSICNITAEPLENFIAISDLSRTRGFQNSKTVNPDQHCQLVVKELAKLHALSWGYKKSKSVLYLEKLHPIIQETFIHENNKENLQRWFHDIDIVRLVNQVYGENSDETELLQHLLQNGTDLVEILIKCLNYKSINENEMENQLLSKFQSENEDFVEESWAVGSHGDLQKCNLLFKYNPKNPEEPLEVALTNFHSFRECCPTMDLAYFFYTSTDSETRESHLEDLLQLYHDSFVYFCTLLKKIPYPGFNINSLRRRYHRAKIFGFLSNILLCTTDNRTGSNIQQEKPDEGLENSSDSNGNFSDFVPSAKKEDDNFESLHTRIKSDINGDAKEFEQQRSF